MSFHDLRHTFGSLCLADGMTIDDVSDLLGHDNIDFTKSIYIHRMGHDRRAFKAIQNVANRFAASLAAGGVLIPLSDPGQARLEPPPRIDIGPCAVPRLLRARAVGQARQTARALRAPPPGQSQKVSCHSVSLGDNQC